MPVLIAVVLAGAFHAAADEIRLDVALDASDVSVEKWMGRDVLSIPGGVVPFDEGEPCLPGIPCTALLPQGCSMDSVTVEIVAEEILQGRYDLAPISCLPISSNALPSLGRGPYRGDAVFPAFPIGETASCSMTGYRTGSFVFVPFRHRQISGALSVITQAKLTIHYSVDPSVPLHRLTREQVDLGAECLGNAVCNPWMIHEWAPAPCDGRDAWASWMVVADSSLEEVLQPLVDHRTGTAGSAEFVSLDWIYSNYAGWDTQEQIRNFLKDAYQNHGLVYALIVGDYGQTTRISSLKVGENTLNNVADLYYSDLDGSWDGDGDHLYGERSDALDLLSDIYVGRFSSDVPIRVQTMVEKTISYETAAPSGGWRTTAILPGAGLWPESDYWGSFVCDSIALRIPGSWSVEKLYETEAGHPNNQVELINEGASLVMPQGHGNAGGVYWYDFAPTEIISNGNYTDLTNIDMLPVFHSMACMSGELTNAGCIAERLMLAPWGGAIAVMFNSGYGWGTPPSTGPSEWLEIHFAEQLLVHGQSEVGVAQAFARNTIRFIPGVPLTDWVMQENNLLGDPALLFAAGQTGIEWQGPGTAGGAILFPPSPNPARTVCAISWEAPCSVSPVVRVYDLSGREVARPADGSQAPGPGRTDWDCSSAGGDRLPAGCYMVVLATDGTTDSERLLLLP
jgi:hypothetical protein